LKVLRIKFSFFRRVSQNGFGKTEQSGGVLQSSFALKQLSTIENKKANVLCCTEARAYHSAIGITQVSVRKFLAMLVRIQLASPLYLIVDAIFYVGGCLSKRVERLNLFALAFT
jgi:hypothetical protein